jgi:hypothetical protein
MHHIDAPCAIGCETRPFWTDPECCPQDAPLGAEASEKSRLRLARRCGLLVEKL